jgi:hypothetical protein
LLDETLVVYLTEFGRTPQINKDAGRDHWPGVFSICFAGAGIRGGTVLGASDQQGSMPEERPVSPEEITATIYQLVGIPPHAEPPPRGGGRRAEHATGARGRCRRAECRTARPRHENRRAAGHAALHRPGEQRREGLAV